MENVFVVNGKSQNDLWEEQTFMFRFHTAHDVWYFLTELQTNQHTNKWSCQCYIIQNLPWSSWNYTFDLIDRELFKMCVHSETMVNIHKYKSFLKRIVLVQHAYNYYFAPPADANQDDETEEENEKDDVSSDKEGGEYLRSKRRRTFAITQEDMMSPF